MAAPRKTYDANQVQVIELSRIFADRNWNSRSETEGDTADDDGKAGNKGWPGLVCSLATSPQRDPVSLRPNPKYDPDRKGEHFREFLLVAGFQRHDAKLFIANGGVTEILKDPKQGAMSETQIEALKTNVPTIRAFVKNLTEAEARAENLAENMQRNTLSGPDIAYGVMRLRKADPNLTDVQVAIILNQNQGYVSRLKKIADGTVDVEIPPGKLDKSQTKPVTILEAWRNAPMQLTTNDMLAIANEADPTKKVDTYLKKTGKVASDTPEPVRPKTGPGAWVENACLISAPLMGAVIGQLVQLGVIELTPKGFGGIATVRAMMQPLRKLPDSATVEQMDKVSVALAAAVRKAATEPLPAEPVAVVREKKEKTPKAEKNVVNGAAPDAAS